MNSPAIPPHNPVRHAGLQIAGGLLAAVGIAAMLYLLLLGAFFLLLVAIPVMVIGLILVRMARKSKRNLTM